MPAPKPERRFPKPAELRELLRTRPIERDPVVRRLSRAHTIADLRAIARRRTPRAVFDYTDGGAEGEVSLRQATEVFERVEFAPRILRDVSLVHTSPTIL